MCACVRVCFRRQTLSKRVAQQLKECAAREDKRVIAKLKTQFESELEKFRQVTKSLEQREREILVALSTDGKGVCVCVESENNVFPVAPDEVMSVVVVFLMNLLLHQKNHRWRPATTVKCRHNSKWSLRN